MSDRADPPLDQTGKKEDFSAPSAGSSEAGETRFLNMITLQLNNYAIM